MFKGILKYLAMSLLITAVFGGALFIDFTVTSNNEDIVLKWETQSELNITEFQVLRKSFDSEFAEIARVEAKGGENITTGYEYLDKSAYKTSAAVYIYKIVALNSANIADGESTEVSVAHSVSGIKRTWGSIKALFR